MDRKVTPEGSSRKKKETIIVAQNGPSGGLILLESII